MSIATRIQPGLDGVTRRLVATIVHIDDARMTRRLYWVHATVHLGRRIIRIAAEARRLEGRVIEAATRSPRAHAVAG